MAGPNQSLIWFWVERSQAPSADFVMRPVQEQRANFALWAVLKSPLMVGTDLRRLSKTALEILTAEEVIAVNQDKLGVAGDLVWKRGPTEASCCGPP